MKSLRGQIYPQRQVLIEYPPQRCVHRTSRSEVTAEPTVHHDHLAVTQFGGATRSTQRHTSVHVG
jgi:hypothetical protein